jgi:hypothetical protein
MNFTKSVDDDVAATLARADEAIDAEEPRGPIAPDNTPEAPADDHDQGPEVAPADTASPFLVQSLGAIVEHIVIQSKKAGWTGAEVPGVYSEEEWKHAVVTNASIVVQRRFPTLADSATPEVGLLCLALPWAIWAVPQMLAYLKARGGIKLATSATRQSNSDSRSNGKRENDFSIPIVDGFIVPAEDIPS